MLERKSRLRFGLKDIALHALALGSLVTSAAADEGFWRPSGIQEVAIGPREQGLSLDLAKLGDLSAYPLGAIVNFGGASGSFVSPQGLIAIADHTATGYVDKSADSDSLKDGMLAKTLADEEPAPALRAYVLEAEREVTQDVYHGISIDTDTLARQKRMEANRRRVVAACERNNGRRCAIVSDFDGARYWLQQRLEIRDLRLVYAPPTSLGQFAWKGDEPIWPSHRADFAFYRAYVAANGVPAPYSPSNVPYHSKIWLKVSRKGVSEGDFVMVAGFPTLTHRYATTAESRFEIVDETAAQIEDASGFAREIEDAVDGDPAAKKKLDEVVVGLRQKIRNLSSRYPLAESVRLMERKEADERDFRAWIAANPTRQSYGGALDSLNRLLAEEHRNDLEDMSLAVLDRVQLLSAARKLYRWAKERSTADPVQPVYDPDKGRFKIEQNLAEIDRTYVPSVDPKILAAVLRIYRTLSARDQTFLDRLDAIGVDKLYTRTELGNPAIRRVWLDKQSSDFEASKDPFIELAVALYPGELARERAAKERAVPIREARAEYLRGMVDFAAERGRPLFPDADGTLRISYGNVQGRKIDGQIWTPFTTDEGLIAQNTGKGDRNVPPVFLERLRAKDYGSYRAPALGMLPIDFMTSAEAFGGNSGSAVLNNHGALVGILFGGTPETGLLARWIYDRPSQRSICTDVRYMLWVMEKDGANRLLNEMDIAE